MRLICCFLVALKGWLSLRLLSLQKKNWMCNNATNSSKYLLQHRWSRRTLPVERMPPAVPCGIRCCSGSTASRSCPQPAPDLPVLSSWSGPDEVNVTDNITAIQTPSQQPHKMWLQDVWSKCVTNVCMLLIRQGSDSSGQSWSQDWKRWSQHRCPQPPSCDSRGAWEEQDWWIDEELPGDMLNKKPWSIQVQSGCSDAWQLMMRTLTFGRRS